MDRDIFIDIVDNMWKHESELVSVDVIGVVMLLNRMGYEEKSLISLFWKL